MVGSGCGSRRRRGSGSGRNHIGGKDRLDSDPDGENDKHDPHAADSASTAHTGARSAWLNLQPSDAPWSLGMRALLAQWV